MNIVDFFIKENHRIDSNIETRSKMTNKTSTPLQELKNFIKMLYDTWIINKDIYEMLSLVINKNFPITYWKTFIKIFKNLEDVATCDMVSSCGCNHDHDKNKITICMYENLKKLFNKVYGNKYNFNEYESCIDEIQKLILSDYDDITFTSGQVTAIKEMLCFLENPDLHVFGLFGFAGTGKTTLITKFIKEMISRKYINSINFSAPTNKAVNVIKTNFANCIEQLILLSKNEMNTLNTFAKQLDYLKNQGININLTTIHKLLEYKNELNNRGEKVFVKKNSTINKILIGYDLIIIDECSMLEIQIIVDLFKTINQQKNSLAKIIFIGDPAQLSPVKEPTSCIFNTKNDDFEESLLAKHFQDNSQYKLNNFIIDVTKFNKIVLKEIVRSSNDYIKNLCNECRMWVQGEIALPKLTNYKSDKVKIYKNKNNVEKTDSSWFKKYINYVKKNDKPVNNIILTWRNCQSDEYNTTIRKKLFKKSNLEQYEAGDILMMNEFYLLRTLEEFECNEYWKIDNKNDYIHDKQNKLYTCEQIKVVDAEVINFNLKKITIPNISEEYTKIIGTKLRKLITDINNRIPCSYQVWKLIVKKLIDNDISLNQDIEQKGFNYLLTTKYVILTHKEDMIETINMDKSFVKKQIDNFSCFLGEKFTDTKKLEMLTEKIIIELWKQINEIMVDPFANVNICFSMTTHKSQSSTYYNVFVDVNDLIKNSVEQDTKKCLYTAVTRASHEVHLLI